MIYLRSRLHEPDQATRMPHDGLSKVIFSRPGLDRNAADTRHIKDVDRPDL